MKWKRIALILTTLSLLVVPLAWSQGGNAEQQIKTNTTRALAHAESLKAAGILPTDLVWASHPAGYQIAKIVGDSTKAGTYVTPELALNTHGHERLPSSRCIKSVPANRITPFLLRFRAGTLPIQP
jgi:hypothetical protein